MAHNMEFPFPPNAVPAHVPAALVRPEYPFIYGTKTDKDPFNDLADAVHAGPEIIYAMHAYPGASPAWVPRKAADIRKIYADTEHFSSANITQFSMLIGESWVSSPAELDPPAHGPFRLMAAPFFAPKAMMQMEDKIRLHARQHIARFARQAACEFMADFAFEFPIRIFLELMGLPQQRMKEFLDWERDLVHSYDLSKVAQTTRSVVSHLRSEIEDRRANPRDDLITFAVRAQKRGEKLTEDEVIGFAFNLFIGGLDTVSTNMGLHFLHLATHPEDQKRLRENPTEIPAAIDEMMRGYGSISLFRTCKAPIEIRGVQFMPGDKVAMSATLGGRDPDEFPDPHSIRFDRKPQHLNFGYGPHLCLGKHLALREIRIAMEEFLRIIPPFRVAEGHKLQYTLGLIQPLELPLVW